MKIRRSAKITAAQARQPKKSKFNNRRVAVDGKNFDSMKEARRYQYLKMLERGGGVRAVKTQRPFALRVNGALICTYVADFTYEKRIAGDKWLSIVEDAKGFRTREFIIKKKLMAAVLGIDVQEV